MNLPRRPFGCEASAGPDRSKETRRPHQPASLTRSCEPSAHRTVYGLPVKSVLAAAASVMPAPRSRWAPSSIVIVSVLVPSLWLMVNGRLW